MKNGTNLLDQFDQLPTIEPSPEWREQLLTRIHQPGMKSHELLNRRLVYLAVVVLLAVNIFSLTRIWLNDRAQEDSMSLRTLASEYLISTNSSK